MRSKRLILFLSVFVLALAAPAAAAQWELPAVDAQRLLEEDAAAGDARVPRVGFPIRTHLVPSRHGMWRELPDGDRVWRLRVRSAAALWTALGFSRFELPRGAELEIYDPERTTVHGPYTVADVRDHGELWIPPVLGDTVVVELLWPAALRGEDPRLVLGTVSHGYRPWNDPLPNATAGACNVDAACPEGAGFEDQRRGTVRLLLAGSVLCSGSLVVNTNFDCVPYVLTADHCFDTVGDGASTVFLFNYDRPACGGGAAPTSQALSGSTLIARHDASDMRLLRLSQSPPEGFNVYWNGWSRVVAPPAETWTIHHPGAGGVYGDPKKISHDADPPTDGLFNGPSHWRILWDTGVTEAGSSGAPLFDPDHRIIGQLNGGASACGGSGADEFGKLVAAWTGGGSNTTRLSDWLDPAGTGALAVDGMDQSLCALGMRLGHAAHSTRSALGNLDNHADPGDRVTLEVSLLNDGPLPASAVSATLTRSDPTDPRVTIVDGTAGWPDIGGLETAASLAPHFTVQLESDFACGESIPFDLSMQSAEGLWTSEFRLETGTVFDTVEIFSDDFESGVNGWTTAGPSPWSQVVSRSLSPTHSWFASNGIAARSTTLEMPTLLDLVPGATLRFSHWMNSGVGFDGGVLEIRVDGGAWQDAETELDLIRHGGYNGAISLGFLSPIEGRAAWTGSLGDWQSVEVDLSSFEGHDVDVRWLFATDVGGLADGWYVDDVSVEGTRAGCVHHLPGARCNGNRLLPPGARPPECGRRRPGARLRPRDQ